MSCDVPSNQPGSGSESDRPDNGNGHHHRFTPPTAAWQRLGGLSGEMKEYLAYLLTAKADGIKAQVRNIGVYAGLGLIGAVAAGAILATASVLLVVGAAHGIGAALGNRPWLGELIIAVAVLAGIGLGAYIAVSKLLKSFREGTVRKYEQRQLWQREHFGRDVGQAAAEVKHD